MPATAGCRRRGLAIATYSRAICEKCKTARASLRRRRVGSSAWACGSQPRRSAARLVGRLSRAVGRGRRHDAAGQAALEGRPRRARRARRPSSRRGGRRLGDEREDDDERDAGPRSSAPRYRLAWNNSGREPRLRRRLHPPLRHRRGARPARGRRVRAARGDAARASARRLARQPLPRPARPLRRARAHRRALAAPLPAALPPRPPSSSTPTTLSSPQLADGRVGALRFGVDDPRLARPALQHAADSKYCVRCGAPVRLRGRLRRPSRRLSLPALRPRPSRARRGGTDDRACTASTRPRSTSSRRPATHACPTAAPRPLQRLQRPRRGDDRARARRRARRDRRGARVRSRAAFGRFERIAAGRPARS